MTLPGQTLYFISQCHYCDVARPPIHTDIKEGLYTIISYILEKKCLRKCIFFFFLAGQDLTLHNPFYTEPRICINRSFESCITVVIVCLYTCSSVLPFARD